MPGPETVVAEWVDGANGAAVTGPTLAHLWTGDGLRELARRLDLMAAAADGRGGLA